MMTFPADPIRILLEVGSDLFPDVTAEVTLHSNKHPDHPKRGKRQCAGFCGDFLKADKQISLISLNVEDSELGEVIDTLAHEIAHAGAGSQNKHNKVWKAAFKAVKAEYNRRLQVFVDADECGPEGSVVIKLKVEE